MLRIGEIMSYESLRSSFLEARCRWDEHAWLYSVQLCCNVSPVNIYVIMLGVMRHWITGQRLACVCIMTTSLLFIIAYCFSHLGDLIVLFCLFFVVHVHYNMMCDNSYLSAKRFVSKTTSKRKRRTSHLADNLQCLYLDLFHKYHGLHRWLSYHECSLFFTWQCWNVVDVQNVGGRGLRLMWTGESNFAEIVDVINGCPLVNQHNFPVAD